MREAYVERFFNHPFDEDEEAISRRRKSRERETGAGTVWGFEMQLPPVVPTEDNAVQ